MPMNDPKPAIDGTVADTVAPAPVRGRGARPLRLPVWKCPRCGARKRLRGTRRGEQETV